MEFSHNDESYKRYSGYWSYAKRFYTPFEKQYIFPIVGFELVKNDYLGGDEAYFEVLLDEKGNKMLWDVEDCVIITNEYPIIEDSNHRIANIHDPQYGNRYNPYAKNE